MADGAATWIEDGNTSLEAAWSSVIVRVDVPGPRRFEAREASTSFMF